MIYKWLQGSTSIHMINGRRQSVYDSLHSMPEITCSDPYDRHQKLVVKVPPAITVMHCVEHWMDVGRNMSKLWENCRRICTHLVHFQPSNGPFSLMKRFSINISAIFTLFYVSVSLNSCTFKVQTNPYNLLKCICE